MNKCRCGKDHTGQKPVDEKEEVKKFAEQIKDEIDKSVLEKLKAAEVINE